MRDNELMIDNASVAAQIDFDDVTIEAIIDNVIKPTIEDERQRAIDIIVNRFPLYDEKQIIALKECISSIRG